MERKLLLDAGSGGRASQRLINDLFLRHFSNDILARQDDAALLPKSDARLAMSIDGHTVSPLFFAGGSIGTLAINGTVNDVAMLGAKPLWLACSFILEEGLPYDILEHVVEDMARACAEAEILIITGDTKVVPAGACDKIFITSSGVGEILGDPPPSGHNARPGDVVIVSGSMGDHGLAVMAAREDVSFLSDVKSDCAPLAQMVANIIGSAGMPHVLRDPTRGGLATTCNEIAEQSGVGIELEEEAIPIHASVADGCSFMGLDPLYLANEGKCVCIVPPEMAARALSAMRASPHGEEAAIIGKISDSNPGRVILRTRIGGQRFLGMLEGDQLPRIC